MLIVSNYHYIRNDFKFPYPSIFGVTPAEFASQLKLLRNQGDFIEPVELAENIDRIKCSRENFYLVTFDDGLKEQFDFAIPILESLGIPAIFFANSSNFTRRTVSTVHKIHLLRSIIRPSEFRNLLLQQNMSLSTHEKVRAHEIYRFDDKDSAELKFLLNFKMDFITCELYVSTLFKNYFDEVAEFEKLYMSSENLRYLSSKGHLGSHTHNHFPLGLLDEQSIRNELSISKSYFEDLTTSTIQIVSYPYGSAEACTLQVAKIAEDVGYTIGFTAIKGENNYDSQNLLLKRFDCNDLLGGKKYNYGN